jgi:malonate decarboxylase acyl carrier protein
METLEFKFTAKGKAKGRAHVGVVGSGDLEVLLEPRDKPESHVRIRTSVPGFSEQWKAVLDRFFSNYDGAATIEINDAGATPGVVSLRLAQAAEASEK